jgi:hypothetical protein
VNVRKLFRSSITGRWVPRWFATKNPRVTVSESSGPTIVVTGTTCTFCHKVTNTPDVCEWCGSVLYEARE